MASADLSHEMPLVAGASEGVGLRRTLDRLAMRRNRLRFWNEIARALCWGVGFAALGVLAYKFYLLDGEWWMVALPILLSALVGYRNGVMKRAGAFDAALDADQTLDLNDRLASALAFTHPELIRQRRETAPETRFLPRLRAMLLPRPVYATATPTLQTSLVPALVQDAAMRASTLDPKAVYPLRFGRPQKALIGATLALSGFVLMPNMPYLLSQAQRTDAKKTLPETGKKLQAIAKEVQDNKDFKDPKTKHLAKNLMALGKRMERARMGKKEALVEMAQLREKVQKAAKQGTPEEFKAQLEPAVEEMRHEQMQTNEGRKMQQHLDKGELEQAAKELEKLADKIEKGNLSKDEKEKAAHDLEKAAQALRKQGGEQNEQMAQKLEQAAKALREEAKQQGQKGQQGEDAKKQGGKQQDGKQGQEKQGQNGQQQGQQGKKPGEQQKAGQNGQQQGDKQGQQQKAGQNGQQKGQKQGQQQGNQQSGQQSGQRSGSQSGSQQAQQGGSQALRKMAESMKGGGSGQGMGSSNSPALERMLGQIREAERQAGSGGFDSGPCPICGKMHSGYG